MISLYSQPWGKLRYICSNCQVFTSPRCFYSQGFDKYSDVQMEKIIKVINDSTAVISDYDISKAKLKKFCQWRSNKGQINTLSDLELVEGFTKRTAIKLYDSILEGPEKKEKRSNKIKGQILHPALSERLRQNCQSVLAVYINVNSVVWTLINRSNYAVTDWRYDPINYPDGKKLQITDIYDIASSITRRLPPADMYVMKAEATSLRAAGSDPNNAKAIAVNLQKAQMIAMMVAMINSSTVNFDDQDKDDVLKHRVYFLRHSLPYRLYGTLVGNERVSTDQTVEMILQNTIESHVKVPENLKTMFRSQKDLPKDMLGHSLLLGLTFMDLCIYKNQNSIDKLMRRNDS
ncbi:uncharacterized protein LOC133523249 [Cydia pomonella]|uniref:uncharacterized protein LOC133523249 n=1 Tax=Cydia pomonella TaxID=82600 RepID=UPI002ADD614F|nr:uncharacterized protein LOC133523249 [Cydia pomonella]